MLGTILARKFPSLIPGVSWVVRQDNEIDGGYLEQWNVVDVPRPTDEELAKWKSEFDPAPTPEEKQEKLEIPRRLMVAHNEILWARLQFPPVPPPAWAVTLVNQVHDKLTGG